MCILLFLREKIKPKRIFAFSETRTEFVVRLDAPSCRAAVPVDRVGVALASGGKGVGVVGGTGRRRRRRRRSCRHWRRGRSLKRKC